MAHRSRAQEQRTEIALDARRRADRPRDPRRARARRSRPGVTTWDLDQLAEDLITQEGRQAGLHGLPRLPGGASAPRSTRRWSTASPQEAEAREGDLMKLDFGVFYRASAATRRAPCRWARSSPEAQGAGRGHPRVAGQGHRADACPGNRLGDIGTPSRPTSRRRASRWCATSWATASARRSTRPRRCRTTAPPAPGTRLRPGLVLAIEPMVNAGHPQVEVLDDDWTAVTLDSSSPPTSSTPSWSPRTARRSSPGP